MSNTEINADKLIVSIEESIQEALQSKAELEGYVKNTSDGLSICDMGSKISNLQGKIDALVNVKFAVKREAEI